MEKEKASMRAAETCEVQKGIVKLFGIIISDQNQHQSTQSSISISNLEPSAEQNAPIDAQLALSEQKVHSKKRKAAYARGTNVKRWTEDEHQKFLKGLKFCGKGDWKGISKYFVTSRTPTQVASHAQKYFIAQASSSKKFYRSSIFDMPLKLPTRVPGSDNGSDKSCPEASNAQPLSFLNPTPNYLTAARVLVPTTIPNLSASTAGPLVQYPYAIVNPAGCYRQFPELRPTNIIETA